MHWEGLAGPIPFGFSKWFSRWCNQVSEIRRVIYTDVTIVCGHWAALGLRIENNLLAIDSGCVWGRQLMAVRLENRAVFQVDGIHGFEPQTPSSLPNTWHNTHERLLFANSKRMGCSTASGST